MYKTYKRTISGELPICPYISPGLLILEHWTIVFGRFLWKNLYSRVFQTARSTMTVIRDLDCMIMDEMHAGEESFSSFDSIQCLAFNIDVYNFDLPLCNYFRKEHRLPDRVCSQFVLQKFKRRIFYLKSFDCC